MSMWCIPWSVEDGVTIEWSGLTFGSRHYPDESPRWTIADTDWWAGGGEDTATIRAPRGQWTGSLHWDSRTVSWSGLIVCGCHDDLLEEMQALQSACGTSLVVDEAGLRRSAVCRKGSVQVTPLTERIATYSAMVVLDDPLVSSVDGIVLNRSADVTNRGSVRSRPVVTVTGTTTAPTVTIGSWSVKCPRALTSGESFTVDCQAGQLYISGTPVFPVLVDFPSIRPGATATISTSAGSGTVEGVSAWI